MRVIYGLFKTTLKTELGLYALLEKGFHGKKVRVVPLDATVRATPRVIDSMYKSDGLSLFDGIAMSASIGMLFGVIFGSVVYIGPIALGIIGFFLGAGIGYLVDQKISKDLRHNISGPSGEIIVSVECDTEEEQETAEAIFREYQAVALGVFRRNHG
ncbi:hypothetical protein GTO91_01000 [Heliobacterium undosum]|uniref:DUF1269 domain-containing protein n=1 Tax=Heliomicrobium undosum TaxID=121734 RepID=A0A845L5U5_9FIRM|nr:hypothetical protein [Heliomicrobium undosum]MZP28301.1 hypothetical protein [Heliomicrobium undosum]